MRIQTLARSLAATTGLALVLMAQPANAQLVTPGSLITSYDSAGNPGQISINNPDASTANISVLAPVVVSNWNNFNVPQNTTLNIANASAAAQASLLARVIGGNFSDMGGTVNANNVNLWLINQNGILFGSNTSVNAKSFFASTLDTTDADFFDFYLGTNNAGNGKDTVRFLTSPSSGTHIVSSGGRFKTDGTLMFVSPGLILDGDFNAGTGSAAFVAATDVSVNFSAGSPLSYTVNKGTTVAKPAIAGSVTGKEAQFIFQNASTLVNGMMTIDANVATTATATERGIMLFASSDSGKEASITTNGTLQSTGYISSGTSGALTFAGSVTGSSVDAVANKALTAQSMTATDGSLDLTSYSALNLGTLSAAYDVNIIGRNAANVALGAVSAGNDVGINTDGNVAGSSVTLGRILYVGSYARPASVSFTGPISTQYVKIDTTGTMSLANVTATGGYIDLDAGGVLTGGALSATGLVSVDTPGAVQLASILANSDGIGAEGVTVGTTIMPSSITVTGATSGGSVRLATSGAMQLGNVSSTAGAVDLDSSTGGISAGAVSATGGNAMLTAPGAITTTSIGSSAAVDVDSTGGGNLDLGSLNAGTTINLDSSGSARFGSATAGGAFAVGAAVDPSSITATGNISAASIDLDATGLLNAQNITATAGGIDIDTGSVQAGALSATNGVAVDAAGAVALTSVSGDSDSNGTGVVLIGGLTTPSTLTISGITKGVNAVLRASGAVSLGNVTSTSGVIDIDSTNGAISAGALSATGGDALVTARGGVTTGSIASTSGSIDVDSTNGGNLNLGNLSAGGNIAVDTNLGSIAGGTVTAVGSVNVGTAAASRPSTVTFSGDVTGSNVTIYGRQNISVKDVTATAGDAFVSAQDAGSTITAGNISATGNAGVRGRGNVTVASVTGDSDSNGSGGASAQSDNSDLTVSGNLRGASVDVYAGGSASIGNATASVGSALVNAGTGNLTTGDIAAAQYAAAYGPGTVSTGALTGGRGVIVASSGGGAVSVGNVASDGAAEFNTAGSLTLGAVTKAWALRIGQTGSLNNPAMPNAINITGNVSAGSIDIDGTGALTAKDLAATTAISLDALGAMSFGNVTAPTAPLTIGASNQPSSINSAGVINVASFAARTTGALSLSGANMIGQINDVSAGGSLLINNATSTTVAGTVTGASDITLTSGGDLTIASTGGVTGGLVALSAFGNFINDSGSDAVTASDHWVVYSNAPAGNVFGGLDSGNTALWNATLATRAPGTISGNRYVFAYQPTLTVASTDATKVYGTDLTGSLNGYYTASGLQPGVAGAYQADTLASILSGTPTITSAGAVANADVAGGPYAMNIAQGSLGVGNGYALVLTSTGKLTVTPKAITATIGANDKTYDGTTAATGSVTLNGTLAGDDIGTGGTSFTFSDKNAGTDKTVTVSGTTLTGADAGNYTLTVPATTLADIFAKAIDASVAANSKTYDGTTAATGSVTLNGVVAGDSVGTSGTTFTFSDKNAGNGKTVTITGTMLTGADAGNYTLDIPASTLADIFAKAIGAAVAANSKTYDGTTAASGSLALNGVLAGDSVGTTGTIFTFSDKNAGTGKTVTASGTTLTGADAGNYTLTLPATALADIFAKAITATVAANDKTYDGTTTGSGSVTLNGVVAGDSVGTSGTTFTFSDKNAGTNKTVAVADTTLTGADAGNYTVTVPTSTLASILQRALLITADDQVKFRNDEDPALTYTVGGQGLVAGDALSGTLTRQPGETLGDYAINQGTLSAGANYSVSYAPGTLSIVRNPVADAAAAGQNALRAVPLPSDTVARRGAVLVVDADGLCPPEDKDCRVR